MPTEFIAAQSRWIVEKIEGGDPVEIEAKSLKDSVYVEKVNGGVVKVKGKVNGITVSGCSKTGIVFDDVIASIELINCKKVQIQVMGNCPTFTLNGCSDISIYLSEASAESSTIVSGQTTTVNVLVKEGDDYKEVPLPELIQHFVEKGKINSTVYVETH